MTGNSQIEPHVQFAKECLAEAEFVLFTAGAGLTAAAGFNYADTALFAREFPGMLQYGFRAQYQLIGFDDWTPDLQWGYWAAHVELVRFHTAASKTYTTLRETAAHIDPANVFVMTSNVDALFERNGFEPEQIYTPQGDYSLLQCTTPCSRAVWTWKEQIDEIRKATDPATQRLTDPTLVPLCPNCGGTVFPNVRSDGSFIHDHFERDAERLQEWLVTARKGRGVVIEIGAGFNTPSVIRWPGERLVAETPTWNLVRMNAEHSEVPKELGERAVGIKGDAQTIIAALREP